jgi:beta-glucanase (GH16 family)
MFEDQSNLPAIFTLPAVACLALLGGCVTDGGTAADQSTATTSTTSTASTSYTAPASGTASTSTPTTTSTPASTTTSTPTSTTTSTPASTTTSTPTSTTTAPSTTTSKPATTSTSTSTSTTSSAPPASAELPALAAVPENVAANAGNAVVTITWTKSSSAATYNVQRGSQRSGPYTKLASPAALTYTDSAVVNGTTYYYVVSAVNTAGQSADSAEVSATPKAPSTASTPSTPSTTSTSAAATPPVAGYVLKFDDEFTSFNGNASGTNGWMTQYPWRGGTRTNNPGLEVEYDSDSSVGVNPFSIVNGVLQIQATQASSTGANAAGLPYNSGAIASSNSFRMQYGYFEMRAQMPPGAGLWPAFWLVPTNLSWPPEIDVLEQLGVPTVIHETLHFTDSSGADAQESVPATVADTTTGFHTYGVDWEPGTVTMYFDGVQTAQWATPSDMNQPMYMIINLAIGGEAGVWAGVPNGSTVFPANMLIDYVRAYASPNSTNIGGSLAQ